MANPPITIKRSALGSVYRVFYAPLAVGLLVGALYLAQASGGPLPGSLFPVVVLYLIAVGFGFLVSVVVYSEGYIELTDSG